MGKNKKQSQNNQSNISSDSYHRAYEDGYEDGYDDCRMNHNDVSRQNEYDYQDNCECDCGYDNNCSDY